MLANGALVWSARRQARAPENLIDTKGPLVKAAIRMTNAEQSTRAMPSQQFILFAVQFGILLGTVWLLPRILENENGGISATVRAAGIFLALWALMRPTAGLYIISVEAFSVDFVKKVAVYYGSATTSTIIDVLVVTMLAIVATIAGTLIQGIALRRFKITTLHWVVLGASGLLSVAIFFASQGANGFSKAGEDAFDTAVPICLLIPMTIFLGDREQLQKLLKVQFWLAVIWAIWGIKQYYTGFLQLEWFYAETGLSAVASDHMLKFAEPRPFGFASGAMNYGVIAPYTVYGIWLLWQQRRNRVMNAVGTLILAWGLVTSLQRTALLFPFIVLGCYYCFRSKGRTVLAYAGTIGLLLLGIASAEYLLDHLSDINSAIQLPGDWADKVLNVGTFSDRLNSWTLLKDPTIYSWFGIREKIVNHDIFTRIIISYGVVGLVVVLATVVGTLTFMHYVVLRIADPEDQKTVTFLLAATSPNLILGFAEGGNFSSNPTNIQIWTFFGAAATIAMNTKLVNYWPSAFASGPQKPLRAFGDGNLRVSTAGSRVIRR